MKQLAPPRAVSLSLCSFGAAEVLYSSSLSLALSLSLYIYIYMCIYMYIYPGGTLLQKIFKIRSWVPSPQMPYFGGRPPHLSDLKKYRRDLVSSELLSASEIIFLLEPKASNRQAASKRPAVKEDELPAELEQQGQRDEARRSG